MGDAFDSLHTRRMEINIKEQIAEESRKKREQGKLIEALLQNYAQNKYTPLALNGSQLLQNNEKNIGFSFVRLSQQYFNVPTYVGRLAYILNIGGNRENLFFINEYEGISIEFGGGDKKFNKTDLDKYVYVKVPTNVDLLHDITNKKSKVEEYEKILNKMLTESLKKEPNDVKEMRELLQKYIRDIDDDSANIITEGAGGDDKFKKITKTAKFKNIINDLYETISKNENLILNRQIVGLYNTLSTKHNMLHNSYNVTIRSGKIINNNNIGRTKKKYLIN